MRSPEKRTNGSAQRVSPATRVPSSDTAAERDAPFICRGEGFWLCAESVLRCLHPCHLQAQNPQRRAHWGLGARDWIEETQTREERRVRYARDGRHDLRGILGRPTLSNQETQLAGKQE